ncbi:PREDICTED: transcription factor bHLH18-like [Ipomoea nil]|uniref:transcription factor bHLH18-like n=1 Tax=Ipomoea nil TaxID=35883 RepID=UPI000901DE01|nr:PREDICTED: transcription factor bHLH18-like [Ipomoea nil]
MDNLSSAEWFSQEMDEWQMMNTFDDFAVFSPEMMPFPSSAGYCSSPFPPFSSSNGFQTVAGAHVVENPAAAVNRVQENPSLSSSSSSIISFANSDLPWATQHLPNNSNNPKALVKTEMVFTSRSCVVADGRKDMIGFSGAADVKKGAARNAVQAQDHVMAERRRREKLTQCFVALSSLVPGLKKLDKASVLGAAIKHIKDLKERVETLEENAKRHAEEPPAAAAAVKRVRLSGSDDDSYSSDENSDASTEMSLPEIEVRSSDQNMLIRVHCKKHNRVIKEIFSEIEKMQLSILSSSVMPFGKTTTHITIIAQMDHKFCMAAKDVASTIRMTILKLLG